MESGTVPALGRATRTAAVSSTATAAPGMRKRKVIQSMKGAATNRRERSRCVASAVAVVTSRTHRPMTSGQRDLSSSRAIDWRVIAMASGVTMTKARNLATA